MNITKQLEASLAVLAEKDFGAKFFKADLHFHTPASEDARGRNRYNFNPYKNVKYPVHDYSWEHHEKIQAIQNEVLKESRELARQMVAKFLEKGLSLVAVTDHNGLGTIWSDAKDTEGNSMDLAAPTWYELICEEAEKVNQEAGKKKITILAGVEISTVGVHILAVFPPQNPPRKIHFIICELLNEIGFSIDEMGKNPKVGKASIYNTIELIHQKGGTAIIAHIDGSDQALLKNYSLTSGAMKNVLTHPNLHAVEIVKPSRFINRNRKLKKTIDQWVKTLRKKEGLVNIAYFQGSDAHNLATIAKRFTYVKMTEPTYEGLVNAMNVPSSRVRVSDLYQVPKNKLFIYGLEIKSKYFRHQFIRFNRHLNCLVGRKESGKSYFFKLMQKALGQADVEGKATLFIENIVDGESTLYAYHSDKSVHQIKQSDGKTLIETLEPTSALALALRPKFFNSDKINQLITSPEKINEFLVKKFGEPTPSNIEKFNQKFAIPDMLMGECEAFLMVKNINGQYRLFHNLNWRTGRKINAVDYFKLSNSIRRILLIATLLVSDLTGPLIIDAPEEYFDNEDIVRYLVPIINQYKNQQQMILSTANSILAVNSDPENYIVLRTKMGRFKGIESGFAIDKQSQKDRVIRLVEGNVKAFKKRGIRYQEL